MKKIFVFVFLPIILAAILISAVIKRNVFVEETKLSIQNLELPNYKGSDWLIKAYIGEESRFLCVYSWIINVLVKRPVVAIDLAVTDEQCYEEDRIPFCYIGEAEKGVHLLLASDRQSSITHLLFVEFVKTQGITLCSKLDDKKYTFYDNQVLIKKVGSIPLGFFGYYEAKDIELEEGVLKVMGKTFKLNLTPPKQAELMTRRFPYRFDAPPYVNPNLLFCFQTNPRTGETTTSSYDLIKAQHDPDFAFLGMGCTPEIGDRFDYENYGVSKNGVHIVNARYFEAHPAACEHLFLIFEKDYEISVDWEAKTIKRDKERILLRKVGGLDLHLSQPFKLKGNTISYTEAYWENKPYMITGPVEHVDYIEEIELKVR